MSCFSSFCSGKRKKNTQTKSNLAFCLHHLERSRPRKNGYFEVTLLTERQLTEISTQREEDEDGLDEEENGDERKKQDEMEEG